MQAVSWPDARPNPSAIATARLDGAPTAASPTSGVGAETVLPGPGARATPGTEPTLAVTVTVPANIQGRVISTLPLALRQEPQLLGALVAYLNSGSTLTVSCGSPGDAVDGSDTWYRVTAEGGVSGYVAARWIELQGVEPGAVPACED
ncbi:MAG: SH3 domain-containing protein [Chloroflexi bacterium]|nr:MAG: SH3 domain-containing protein [Chloroflexota bacterium]